MTVMNSRETLAVANLADNDATLACQLLRERDDPLLEAVADALQRAKLPKRPGAPRKRPLGLDSMLADQAEIYIAEEVLADKGKTKTTALGEAADSLGLDADELQKLIKQRRARDKRAGDALPVRDVTPGGK